MTLLVAVAIGLSFCLVAGLAFRRAHELRVVHCPVGNVAASVHLDPIADLVSFGRTARIRQCSRWPERQDCRQSCRLEIESSHDACAFRTILADWYVRKDCAYCARTIPAVSWGALRPGLLSPERRVVFWSEVAPTAVFQVLATHRPVCASCAVAEAFRQRHPDRVVERPQSPTARG